MRLKLKNWRSIEHCQNFSERGSPFSAAVFREDSPLAVKDDRMCSIQIKLTEQHRAAELAYRSGITRMKETRGQEFERAWRLVENRRASLERARQILREHEQEHLCGMQESFAAVTGWPRPILNLDGVVLRVTC